MGRERGGELPPAQPRRWRAQGPPSSSCPAWGLGNMHPRMASSGLKHVCKLGMTLAPRNILALFLGVITNTEFSAGSDERRRRAQQEVCVRPGASEQVPEALPTPGEVSAAQGEGMASARASAPSVGAPRPRAQGKPAGCEQCWSQPLSSSSSSSHPRRRQDGGGKGTVSL